MQRAARRTSEIVLLPELGVRLIVKVNRRARRINLRADPATGAVTLVLPTQRDLARGLRFARGEATWLRKQLARQQCRVPFSDGNVVPYRGASHTIRHAPGACGGVWQDGETLLVGGTAAGVPERLTGWLRDQARIELVGRAKDHAAMLGLPVGRISIRDPRSQWGSCSKSGNLSFSWRLVLAPTWVLDYVAAHEVTHMVEFGHGCAFRRTLAGLCPQVKSAEAWLTKRGHELHRYG